MTFDEAMGALKRHQDIARKGRKLRLLNIGLFDISEGEFKRTEFTDNDRAAKDWEPIEQSLIEATIPFATPVEVAAPEVVDDALREENAQ